MIVTVTPNPAVDHVYVTQGLVLHDANRALRVETDAGGKGINVSRVLTELGTPSLATGFLAGGNGAFVRQRLDSEGVRHDFVEVPGETRANVSVEDGSGHPPTVLGAPGPSVEGTHVEELLAKLSRLLPAAAWCVFGGSLPKGMETEAVLAMAQGARRLGVRVAVDADGPLLEAAVAMGVDLVKPNAAEATRLTGQTVATLDDARHAATAVHARLAATNEGAVAVVSVGREGAAMATAEGVCSGPAIAVESKSTIGSGDSMVAGILHGIAAGMPPRQQLALGLAAGAATAMSDGSRIGTRGDAMRLLPRARVG